MARILQQKLVGTEVVAEIQLTKDEAIQLGGVMDNVTVFTEERANTPTRISLRGKKEATKYFLIPKTLRKKLNVLGSVSCQRIRKEDKDIFVYVVNSDAERKSYLMAE